MKKIFYEKVMYGKKTRYVPVSEYDSNYLDSFPKGNHLVMCYPGGNSRSFNIDPNYATLIAAARIAEEAMCRAIIKASELRPERTPITLGQKKAWEKLAKEFGSDLCTLHGESIHSCVDAGIKAMITEADILMSNPAVKKAYEHFLLVCELTKDENPRTNN